MLGSQEKILEPKVNVKIFSLCRLCCYGSVNFENTAFRLFSSNVLYEMCPMGQY